MTPLYNVSVKGKIIPGWKTQEVRENLAAIFKMDLTKADKLLSGKPVVVKKNIGREQAVKLLRMLEEAGVDCEIIEQAGAAGPASATPSAGGSGFTCPECGQVQTEKEECIKCGVVFAKLSENRTNSPPSADHLSQGDPEALLEDDLFFFVAKNQHKYMDKFEKFNDSGDRYDVTWNWATFFFGSTWLLYRKLYMWTVISIIASFIPVINFFFHFGLTMSANFIYYRHARKKIEGIRSSNRGGDIRNALSEAGGVNLWMPAVLILIAVAGVIAAVSIPNFVSYKNKAALAQIDTNALLQPTFYTTEGIYQAGTACVVNIPELELTTLITAHHLFSPAGGFNRPHTWDMIPHLVRKVRATSVTDTFYEVETSEILPIPGAHALDQESACFDLAVFPLEEPPLVPVLTLAEHRPRNMERVWLFARIHNSDTPEKMLHPARIIQSDQTGIAYVFNNSHLNMRATSGAPVLNSKGEVTALNIGSVVQNGKLIGIGNPATEIHSRIEEAIRDSR